MERVADRIISNHQAIRKPLCVMTLAPYGWSKYLAGEEEPHVWLSFLIG